jgi:hypothetical protein
MQILRWLRQNRIAIAILLGLDAITVGWAFSSSGSVQLYGDPGVPPFRPEILTWSVSKLSLWSGQGLGFAWGYPSELPFDIAGGGLAFVGVPAQLVPSIVILTTLTLAGVAMYALVQKIGLSQPACLIAAIAYSFGPVFLTEIFMSHLLSLVSYSLLPVTIYLFDLAMSSNRPLRSIVATSAVAALAGGLVLQYFPIIILLFVFDFAFRRNLRTMLPRFVTVMAAVILVFFGANSYDFYTASGITSQGPFDVVTTAYNMGSTAYTLFQGFTLSGYNPPFFSTAGSTVVPVWFAFNSLWALVPWIALMGRYRRARHVVQYALVGLLGIFLLTFPTWTGQSVTAALASVPGSVLYRALTHFAVLIAFSLAILTGFAVQTLLSKAFHRDVSNSVTWLSRTTGYKTLHRRPWTSLTLARHSRRTRLMALTTVLVGFSLINSAGFFAPWSAQTIQPFDFNSYQGSYDYVTSNSSAYNVLYIPMDSIVKFNASWIDGGRDTIQLASAKPAPDTFTPSEALPYTIYLRQLMSTTSNTTTWASSFGIIGIAYVVTLDGVISGAGFNVTRVQSLLSNSSAFRNVYSDPSKLSMVFLNLNFHGFVYAPSRLLVTDNATDGLSAYGATTVQLSPAVVVSMIDQGWLNAANRSVQLSISPMDLIRQFLPSSTEVNLADYVPLFQSPADSWTDFDSTWWSDPWLSYTLTDPVLTDTALPLRIPWSVVTQGPFVITFNADVFPTSRPVGPPGPGLSVSVSGSTFQSWNATTLPLSTMEPLLVVADPSQGRQTITFTPTADGEQLILSDLRVASLAEWDQAENLSQQLVETVSHGRFSLQALEPPPTRVDMSNFTFPGAPPGAMYSSGPTSASECFTVNRSAPYDTIALALWFSAPQNWSNYSQLSFSIEALTAGNFYIWGDVYGSSTNNLIDYNLRQNIVPNLNTAVSIALSGVDRSSIREVFLSTGFNYDEFSNGQRVCFQIRDLGLVPEPIRVDTGPIGGAIELTATEQSPVSYQLSNCTTLSHGMAVAAMNYDPAWQVVGSSGTIIGLQHVEADGFVNAWYGNGTTSGSCRLSYDRQSAYQNWLSVSLLSWAACGVLLVIPFARIHKRRPSSSTRQKTHKLIQHRPNGTSRVYRRGTRGGT